MIYRFETQLPDTLLEINSLDDDKLLSILTTEGDKLSVQVDDSVLYDIIGTLLKIQGKRNFREGAHNA